MSDPSAPTDQAFNPPAANTLTCKTCNRTLATISAEGDLQPQGELDEGCELCKDMAMHCNEYEEVKGYFRELQHRRNDFRPRQLALEIMHEAQMNLGNFIQSVAAWGDSDSDEASGVAAGDQQTAEQTALLGEPAEAQPRHKRSLSPQSSPPRKRTKRLRLSERERRVSFDPSVVFRDAEAVEKRVDAEFSRNSEGYSPGRYAAPAGTEWLDTSGNSLRETQFFGMQKRGKKWVPTKEGLEMDDEWEMSGEEGDAGIEEKEESDGEAGIEEKEESNGETGIEEVDGDHADRPDVQMEDILEESEAAPSTNITLPHHALVAASDPSIQPLGPDPEPSSEATTDILINEHLPPSDDAALTELAPLNGE